MPNSLGKAVATAVLNVKRNGGDLDVNCTTRNLVQLQAEGNESDRFNEIALALIKEASKRQVALCFRREAV